MFFTVFPEEAEQYIARINAAEEEDDEDEEDQQAQERYDQIVQYVEGLSLKELRIALINALLDEEERDYEFD